MSTDMHIPTPPVTMVLGASAKPERYSYKAIHRLRKAGESVYAVGLRDGQVADVDIHTDLPEGLPIDTVTLYLGPGRQKEYEAYLLDLAPRRIIFNPGTDNPPFVQAAREAGIEVVQGCTLVMLSTGTYSQKNREHT